MALSGIIKSEAYNFTDNKKGKAYWALEWSATSMDVAGYTKVDYILYKEREYLEDSSRINTDCSMVITPIVGEMESPTFIQEGSYTPTLGSYSLVNNSSKIQMYTGYFRFDDTNDTGSSFGTTKNQRANYGSGSFIIKHNNAGIGKFKVELAVRISIGIGNEAKTANQTFELNEVIFYSSVTGPWNQKLGARGVVDTKIPIQKGEKIIPAWYGANDGINNKIKQYNIYLYQQENCPLDEFIKEDKNLLLTQTVYPTDSNSWLETELVIPENATSGWWIFYVIETVPTLTDAVYGKAVETYGVYSFLINTPPNPPTVSTSQMTIPNIASVVTFKGEPGLDNEYSNWNGQSNANFETMTISAPVLVYSVSSGAIQTITNPSSFNISIPGGSESVVVSFQTYDGKEYSETVEITLKRNIKPEVTISASKTNLLNAAKNTTNYPYLVTSTLTAENRFGTGQDSNNKYRFGIEYNSKADFSGVGKIIQLRDLDTSAIYNVSDARDSIENFASIDDGFYIRFYTERYDSLELSDKAYSEVFYIPPKPSFYEAYNQLNGVNISDLKGYFSTNLSFKFDLDEGYQGVEISSPLVKTGAFYKEGNYMYVNIEGITSTELQGGRTYNFNFNFKKQNKTYYSTDLSNNKMTRVNTFGQANIENSFNTKTAACKIYTYSGNLLFNLTLAASDGTTINDLSNMKGYGITDFYNSCFLILKNGNERRTLPLSLSSSNFNQVGISYSLALFPNEVEKFYNALPTSLDRNSVTSIELGFGINDDFGSSIEFYDTNNFWLNFIEDVIFENNSIFISKEGSSKYIELNPNKYFLKESMQLYYSGIIKSYNSSPVGQIQINRGDGAGWIDYGESLIFSAQSNILPSRGNPIIYTVDKNFFSTLGRIIRQDYKVDFRITVTAAGNNTVEDIMEQVQVREHQPGIIRFNNISLSDVKDSSNQSKISFQYIINNPGISLWNSDLNIVVEPYFYWRKISQTYPDNNKLPYNITGANNIDGKSLYCQQSEVTGAIPYSTIISRYALTNEKIQDSAIYGKMNIKITFSYSIEDLNFDTTYITESTEIAIYNVAPTVAYRQNYLGINTNTVDALNVADGVIIISTANDQRKKVIFTTPTGELIASVNAGNGEIEGFIINGGSWN